MVTIQRRGFVGVLAAAVGSLLTWPKASFGATASVKQPGLVQDAPQRAALLACRFVNTAQANGREQGLFIPFTALTTSRWVSRFGIPSSLPPTGFEPGAELVTGFVTVFALSDDRRHYSMLLVRRDSGFACFTDETGVI